MSQRPPPANAKLVSQVSCLGPIGQCLKAAIDEIIAEDTSETTITTTSRQDDNDNNDKTNNGDNDDGGDQQSTNSNDDSIKCEKDMQDDKGEGVEKELEGKENEGLKSTIKTTTKVHINEEMKEYIMKTFGEAVAKTTWDIRSSISKSNLSHSSPAALIRAQINHYNRMGGQWRIVASKAKIRRRVNLDDTEQQHSNRKKRRHVKNLWEKSQEIGTCANNNKKQKSSAGAGDDNGTAKALENGCDQNENNKDGSGDDGFTINLNGKLQILGYDDVV